MLSVRSMQAADVPACCALINHSIAQGGTTAHEEIYSEDGFANDYFECPTIVNVVEAQGRIVGFQAAFEQDPGVFSIGSFTDRRNPVKGAGRALVTQMIQDCRAAGGSVILAKITSDNTAGLGFYTRVGFDDWQVWPKDHQRPKGHWVDRIVKRYIL